MSILDQIRKTTRQGLERLGVTLNIPDTTDIPDDEDTRSRDFFEIYSDIMERSTKQSQTTLPVPSDLSSEMKKIAASLCNNNQTLLSTIDSWIEDRRSILSEIDETVPLTKEKAISELYTILERLCVLQNIPTPKEDWLKTSQSIAQIQERSIRNLLLQASNQLDTDSLDDWICQMNERIQRFGVRIVLIENRMGIVNV